MGIPVVPIDCKYSVDIQQKIPLGINRDTISPAFMKDVYAEVLNATYDLIEEDEASDTWVKIGFSDTDRVTKEASKEILTKRFGEKICSPTPSDPNSIDDAISEGYSIVRGLSKDEWNTIRTNDIMPSSSELFGHEIQNAKDFEPTMNMNVFSRLAKKIAKEFLGINIEVRFVEFQGVPAQYGNRTFTVNVKGLGTIFFKEPLSWRTLELIIHEICHEHGNHTEKSYQKAITTIAGKMIMKALDDPEFYNVE